MIMKEEKKNEKKKKTRHSRIEYSSLLKAWSWKYAYPGISSRHSGQVLL
jgi:hypothetical protein